MVDAAGGGLAAVRAVQQGSESDPKCVPVPPSAPKPSSEGPRSQRLGNTAQRVGKSSKRKAPKCSPKSRAKAAVSDEEIPATGEDIEKVRIKDPSMRGVSFGQLLDFFLQECGDVVLEDTVQKNWQRPLCVTSTLSRKCIQRNQAKRLEISEGKVRELVPNLYAVDELAISPKCEPACMSMAELWNPSGLLIHVFISHCWSENFGDFVQGVYRFMLSLVTEGNAGLTSQEIHARAREMTLYIWAFSNNRWKAEGLKQLESSLFFKVLQADSTWHVVISIDQSACVWQRAWCCIEYYFARDLDCSVILNTHMGPLQELELEAKAEELWILGLVDLLQEVNADCAQACRRSDLELIQTRIQLIDGTESAPGVRGGAALSGSLRAYVANVMVHRLAKIGNAATLRLALESFADPNGQDHNYIRPLTYAAALHGVDSQAAQLLIGKGADDLALQSAEHVANLFDHDKAKREEAMAKVGQLTGAPKEFHASSLLMARRAHEERAVNEQATALVSANLQARLDALHAISRLGPAAAPAAACRLGDSEPAVRSEAEKVLERIDDVSTAASNLARLLNHEIGDVRRRAVGWLGMCGGEAAYFVTDIAELLTDPEIEVATETKQALVNLGENAVDAVNDIAPLLKHQDLHVRRCAAEILQAFEQDSWTYILADSRTDLALLLMDRADEVRSLVASTLRTLDWNSSKVLPIIVSSLSGQDSEARLAARRALESLGNLAAEAAADIAPLLVNEDADVRKLAAEMMFCIEWSTSSRATKIAKKFDFASMLPDDCEDCRTLALDALEFLGDAAGCVAPQVVSLISYADPRIRELGIATLATCNGLAPNAGPALAKLFEHQDSTVRICAIKQIGELGEHASKCAVSLVPLLEDPPGDVRDEAVQALEKLEEHAATAAPKLAKFLKHDEGEVRVIAARLLRQMGEEEGEPGSPYRKKVAIVLGDDAPEEETTEPGNDDDDVESLGDEGEELDEQEDDVDDDGDDDEEDDEQNDDDDDNEDTGDELDATDDEKSGEVGSDDGLDETQTKTALHENTTIGADRNTEAVAHVPPPKKPKRKNKKKVPKQTKRPSLAQAVQA